MRHSLEPIRRVESLARAGSPRGSDGPDVSATGLGQPVPDQPPGGSVPPFDDDLPDLPEPSDRSGSDRPGAQADSPIRRQLRGPWGRLARRWVPEPLRDTRVDPGRRGTVVLAAVAALAAVIAAVGVWRDRPVPHPVNASAVSAVATAIGSAPPAGSAPAGTAGGGPSGVRPSGRGSTETGSPAMGPPAAGALRPPVATGTPTLAAPRLLVVSVTGRVRHPGLVRLRPGARVDDAIRAAGGARPDAELTGLNLAAPVQDGESVVVAAASAGPPGSVGGRSSVSAGPDEAGGTPGSSGTTGTPAGPPGVPGTTAGSAPLDLNTADAAALDALPGVGPVTAAAIVGWRQKNGRFTRVEQLQEIAGIGPAKFAQLAPRVRV